MSSPSSLLHLYCGFACGFVFATILLSTPKDTHDNHSTENTSLKIEYNKQASINKSLHIFNYAFTHSKAQHKKNKSVSLK